MMASATVLPQDNLRSYNLSALQHIYRDLETVSSSIDRNITEHVISIRTCDSSYSSVSKYMA